MALCLGTQTSAKTIRRGTAPCRASRQPLVVSAFRFNGPPKPEPAAEDRPVACEPATVDSSFKRSIDTMLHRAASSLTRGPCTCLTCRGGGTVACAHCKGTGHLSRDAMERSQMVRGAVRAIKAAVGLQHEVPYTSSQYMVTNRCSRCHGHGRLICEPCTGSGLRYPYLGKADPRQCAGQPGASAADECPIE